MRAPVYRFLRPGLCFWNMNVCQRTHSGKTTSANNANVLRVAVDDTADYLNIKKKMPASLLSLYSGNASSDRFS